MKKVLVSLFATALVVALAVPVMASGLVKTKDAWVYNAEEAGTLNVKDNKVSYEYEVVAGENFLGLQRNYTGQLQFVQFEPAKFVCPGHEFINDTGVIIQERTCTRDGINEAACSVKGCNAIGTRVLPALGHDYYWIYEEPTCEEEGKHILTCTRDGCDFDAGYYNPGEPALGHDPSDTLCDGEYTWGFDCQRCGEEKFIVGDACGFCKNCVPAKTSDEWIADIRGALDDLVGNGNILDIVGSIAGNNTAIYVEIDGVTYEFVGGKNAGSDKFCTIEGVRYQINIYGNPEKYRVFAL